MYTQSTNLLKSGCFQLAARLGQVAITAWERAADPPFANEQHYLSYQRRDYSSLLAALKQRDKLSCISASCEAAARQILSWSNIAERWQDALNGVEQSAESHSRFFAGS